MKGMIFVELMNFMDESFGADFTERVIEQADLPNEAAFTTVGNYPSEHAGALVEAASLLADADAAGLCEAFGRYLFQRFEVRFPHLLHRYASARELLDHVQSHIHEEVKVIYPGATPPSVTTHECEGGFIVAYRSHRAFAHIAFGLVQQCIVFYSEHSRVEWCPDSVSDQARFIIRPGTDSDAI
ncbi:Heme NO binding protein [Halomonas sp. THAF5a]|uniref:heme NO-binding domain-containing protein n=1 Tax=Halomonas sp. THAF5a TaxID=2587844 RepID=UPI001267AE5E|nr:heme NO-binding domain-containing protein [Halomonas sp. THAF5a]QFU00714.1 Heme NO binding protein [Halomonas sp. THAF5a]